ncbi:GBF1 (predicted) [Pycnogonum litorale]
MSSCPENGVYIVVGEMSLVVTAMKKGNRWSSHVYQDEHRDVLLRNFSNLKEVLNHVSDLSDLEPYTFLSPFLDVIRSEDTTGPVTGLALSSVNKFLAYNLIAASCESAPVAVENIADAITHARFVGTDPGSDEVVLIKILHVLRTLLLTPVGALLTNESVCEIMQSCFRICFEMRLSELLRKSAEHSLMDMVQLLFSRLPQFSEDSTKPGYFSSMNKKLKMRTGSGLDASSRGNRRKKGNKDRHKRSAVINQSSSSSRRKSDYNARAMMSGTPATSSEILSADINTYDKNVSGEVKVTSMSLPTPPDSFAGSPVVDSTTTVNNYNPNVDEVKLQVVSSSNQSEMSDSNPHLEITSSDDIELKSNENNSQRDITEKSSTSNLAFDENIEQKTLNVDVSKLDVVSGGETTETLSDVGCVEVADDLQSFSSMTDMSVISSTSIKDSEYVNQQGVRFTSDQQCVKGDGTHPLMPYGLPCVRELLRFLVSLTNPHERHNTDIMIHIGLTLLTVALESGADYIGNFKSLMILVKDEMCRNFFSLLNSERLSVFAATLRVSFLLFESMRSHLKLQLEMYLTKLMGIIVSETQRVTYEQREIALDSVVQLWRIPGLVTELYLNYDCDLYCSNLFEDLTKLLSKNAFPVSGLFSTHQLSLDALLTVVDCIENHCHSRILHDTQLTSTRTVTHGTALQESTSAGEESEKSNSSQIVDAAIKVTPIVLQPSGYQMALHLKRNDSTDINGTSLPSQTTSNKKHDQPSTLRHSRTKTSDNIPNHETLMAIKHRKKLLASGTEQFNSKPSKGILFLQENGLLSTPLDPMEVAVFLKEDPKLDKKMIGEYISNKKNLKVLEAFVRSFTFERTRVDEALRMYLEMFRLPGEAPVISLLLEQFADHWHISNKEPFSNSDAAFTLAYAIIMLNVDQHNHNVKKQSNPMTLEEFKKNLSRVNGGQDFDQDMLEDIYYAIRTEEIVMPAEQTGIVRENYLWKVLLKRGSSKDGVFISAPNGLYDHDLFTLIWGPTVAALSFVFDKSSHDASITQRAISGFRKCAMISAHYGMSDVFDNLIISLLKFTTLLNTAELSDNVSVTFGYNIKAQLAAKTVFNLAHRHGDVLREGWKNILDCVLQLYKAKLLPKAMVEAEDFVHPRGLISLIKEEIPAQRAESGLLSSFYSYITLTSDNQIQKGPSLEDEAAIKAAQTCIIDCHVEQLITESKFLRMDSLQELVKAIIFASQVPDAHASTGGGYDEESTVFFLELLIKIVIQNRDRAVGFWSNVRDHIYSLVMSASASDHIFLMERAVVGMLRLAIRLLRKEEMAAQVLQSLRMLLLLKPHTLLRVSRQVSFALHELLRTNAANIHSCQDWSTLFTLLECVGAGCKPPKVVNSASSSGTESEPVNELALHNTGLDSVLKSGAGQSDSEVSEHRTIDSGVGSDRGYTSDSELYNMQMASQRGNIYSSPAINAGSHQALNKRANIGITSLANGGGGWILVGKEGEIETVRMKNMPAVNQYTISLDRDLMPHDTRSFMKSCESLAFLIRDVAHITPENFESCVRCIQTFVEASINGGRANSDRRNSVKYKEKKVLSKRRSRHEDNQIKRSPSSPLFNYHADDEGDDDEEPPGGYHQISIQLLDLMHTLHTRAASIFSSWAAEQHQDEFGVAIDATADSLWTKCWCPLLQCIARLCCDVRRQVRTSAVTYLQRALLVHDLQTLSAVEWEACFNKVLFPLLSKLLEKLNVQDPIGMEETRVRAATLLSKVFLQHLTPLLSLPTFTALWLTILDFMDKYMHADDSDLLYEAIPESLKNMLLVMDTAGIFHSTETGGTTSQLWTITWDRIDTFLPGLRDEVFKPSATDDETAARDDTTDDQQVEGQSTVNNQLDPCNKEDCSGVEPVVVSKSHVIDVPDFCSLTEDIDADKRCEDGSSYAAPRSASPSLMSSHNLGSTVNQSIILHSPLPQLTSSCQQQTAQLHHPITSSPVPILLNAVDSTAQQQTDRSPMPMTDISLVNTPSSN